MLVGIDSKETIEFVSQHDKSDPKTVFIIGNISNRDKLKIVGSMASANGTVQVSGIDENSIIMLKASIKGVKNLNGKDYDKFDDDVMDLLPFEVLVELITESMRVGLGSIGELEKN